MPIGSLANANSIAIENTLEVLRERVNRSISRFRMGCCGMASMNSIFRSSITARFENGVLMVNVPKVAKAKPLRIPIGAADKQLIEG